MTATKPFVPSSRLLLAQMDSAMARFDAQRTRILATDRAEAAFAHNRRAARERHATNLNAMPRSSGYQTPGV